VNWEEIIKQTAFWGPGAVVAAVIIGCVYRLADRFIGRSISGIMEIGHAFVDAQREQAASLAKLAQGTEGLRDSINNFVTHDNQEHREMIILLKYTRGEINALKDTMETIARHLKDKTT